jgi:hypothetical protein
MPWSLTLALTTALTGCVGPLPFQPERQPFGFTISADVRTTEDQLHIVIDSEGYRVERVALVGDGAAELAPETIVPPASPAAGGLSVGLGIGSAGWGSGGSYSVATGVGIPIGTTRSPRTTLAVFRLDQAGPPPWRLRVKVIGVDPVEILLDPAARSGGP